MCIRDRYHPTGWEHHPVGTPRRKEWPVGQVVQTAASHAVNIGSNPVLSLIHICSALCPSRAASASPWSRASSPSRCIAAVTRSASWTPISPVPPSRRPDVYKRQPPSLKPHSRRSATSLHKNKRNTTPSPSRWNRCKARTPHCKTAFFCASSSRFCVSAASSSAASPMARQRPEV